MLKWGALIPTIKPWLLIHISRYPYTMYFWLAFQPKEWKYIKCLANSTSWFLTICWFSPFIDIGQGRWFQPLLVPLNMFYLFATLANVTLTCTSHTQPWLVPHTENLQVTLTSDRSRHRYPTTWSMSRPGSCVAHLHMGIVQNIMGTKGTPEWHMRLVAPLARGPKWS